MNKRVFEVSMGDSSEEYIRKASIALAVIGFFLPYIGLGTVQYGKDQCNWRGDRAVGLAPVGALHTFLYTTGLRRYTS